MKSRMRFFICAAVLIFAVPAITHAQADLTPEQKAQLQAELVQVEAEQKQAEAELSSAQAESSSLTRDIKVLDAKIKAAQLDIKAKTLLIQTLGNDITAKQTHIDSLEARISVGKESLAAMLRKTDEIDSYSLPEVVLSQSSVAGFFTDLDTFESLQNDLKQIFEQIRSDEASTTAEKDALDKRRNNELDAKYVIEQEQKNIQSDENDKQGLLSVSKGNEKSYSSLVAQKAAKAAQIRAALFTLRDAAAIPFGDALRYAQEASVKTGVRPAFLLAILTQESALGKNVGTCYLSNASTGDGIGAKTGALISGVMKPDRDVQPFLEIAKAVGFDPYKTVVSCPQSVGYGGAMGPAQFIPSTWLLFKDRIATAVGTSDMPDPWNPAHAFMASAIYLGDLGAGGGGYSAERNAACRYYSGKTCSASSIVASYGNQVIAKADTIQRTMIDLLAGL